MTAWPIVAMALLVGGPAEDDGPLSLADLAAEHAAVTGRGPAAEPPTPVKFRMLWDHPDDWRGRLVTLRGRVARVFRQAAFGEFPPLVEAWIEEPPGNLFCAVFKPDAGGGPTIAPGAKVKFDGVFLRRLRYAADDGDRLAPLVVGSAPPTVETRPPLQSPDFQAGAGGWAWSDSAWGVGLFISLAALAAAFAWRTVARPAPLRRRPRFTTVDPDPQFLDPQREPADGDSR